MNCREFRRKHDAYVDDTLSGVDLEAMGRHLRFCESCAQRDTRIRRSLLIARNLPRIEPSASFHDRLQLRLAEERAMQGTRQSSYDAVARRHHGPLSASAYVALAAGIALAAGVTMIVTISSDADQALRLAPVVASQPEPEPSSLATPTMVASMPAGMPMWSAVFVAQQAPAHFASDVSGR
ncbi:MAG: zf-HC2 domain-containing protein [Gemmatimonadaceae bacterium]